MDFRAEVRSAETSIRKQYFKKKAAIVHMKLEELHGYVIYLDLFLQPIRLEDVDQLIIYRACRQLSY